VFLGLLLLAAFIWFAGPYFAFAEVKPLESVTARLVAIALVVVLWGVATLLRQLRAARAGQRIAKAVIRQQEAAPAGGADAREAQQLRERFEEAVTALKTTQRGSGSLYELPWYVIIGPPGSGKTTALVNSGLSFPLAQRFGKEALRGVGGTRNCDWWFTDEAVFLDTAGRYTTQDSDESADSAGWQAFLEQLKKYRKRRPVNGLIVAFSASDLMTQSPRERDANIAAVRRRLDEINRHLRISLPIYLMVTKCDLVAGFSEYFEDLAQEGRAQVWGATFDLERSSTGEAVRDFGGEFDALIERINAGLFSRLEDERDTRRRTAIFAFPQQVAGLRGPLEHFVQEVFGSTRFDSRLLLRGVYFTSGTQEGTPIDRLMGAISRSLALAPAAVASTPSGRGKAYFIERLLKDVVLREAGLAGVNRRLELQKAALQLGTYAACVLVAVLGVIAFAVSYGRNKAYVAEVAVALEQLEPPAPNLRDAALADVVPRLDGLLHVVETAEQHRGDRPLSMRWGLYQGGAVGNEARDAYLRELNSVFLPRVAEQLKQQLLGYASEPEKLYEYLKAYLMLGQPEHLDETHLAFLVDLQWQDSFASRPDLRDSLNRHLRSLLDEEGDLRALPLDDALVAQARNAIRQASVPRLMYSRLKLNYLDDAERALRLDIAAGLGSERVFARRSGIPLSQPVQSLYTKAVFDEVSGLGTAELVKQYSEDSWVLGESALDLAGTARMAYEVMGVYEEDYLRTWDAILEDIQVVPFRSLSDAKDALGVLAGPASPLRGLLTMVEAHTNLTKPKPGADQGPDGDVSGDKQGPGWLGKLLDSGKKAAGVPEGPKPGARVTAHFQPLHRLIEGPPGGAPIDKVLVQLAELQAKLDAVGTGLGDRAPVIADPALRESIKALMRDAKTLPSPASALVAELARRTDALSAGQARGELMQRYRQDVFRPCTEILEGRYPFVSQSTVDVPLADFGALFGYGGAYQSFFDENLAPLVDTSRSPWTWRAGGSGSIGISTAVLRQFELAQRIRETYFQPGGQLPEVRFSMMPLRLDPQASRVVVEIDGQVLDYRHGPPRSATASWPGPAPGVAAVSFEELSGGRPNAAFQGPWAFFRLLERAQLRAESGVRYVGTFAVGGRTAEVAFEATSIRNPFLKPDLRQFRCGS